MFLVSVWARLRPFGYAECLCRAGCKPGELAGESRRTHGQVAQGVLCLCVRSCVSTHAQAGLVTGKGSSTNGNWVIMPFWKLFFKLGYPYGSDWQSLSVLRMWSWSKRRCGAGAEGGEGHRRTSAEDQLAELGGKGQSWLCCLHFPHWGDAHDGEKAITHPPPFSF